MNENDSRVQDLFNFILERERIRLRRAEGSPRPWTEDLILRTYKFTNFRRDDDWTTQQLMKIYSRIRNLARKPGLFGGEDSRLVQILMTCATFRYFGTAAMAKEVHWVGEWSPSKIRNNYERVLESGQRAFTGAYNISNRGMSLPKVDVVLDTLSGLHDDAIPIVRKLRNTYSWKSVIGEMRTVDGFGGTGFMAKEVVLDMILAGAFIREEGGLLTYPRDWLEWTPVGPGARKGATCLTIPRNSQPSRKDIFPMSESRALGLIMDIYHRRSTFMPDRVCVGQSCSYSPDDISPHDIQWWLCEFAKYERTRWGLGRPRSRFTPRSST